MKSSAPRSESEFKTRLKASAERGDIPKDAADPELFESWEDAENLVKYYKSARIEPLGHRDVAGRRRVARANPATRSSASKAPRRSKRTSPTTARSSTGPRRSKSKIADRVQPGVSLGPPLRYIGNRFITPEVDVSDAKFRRQRVGAGKCTGSDLTDVRRAFAEAYMMIECAKEEVRSILRKPEDARVLWHASLEHETSSLSYWFGENYTQKQTMEMLHHIDDILTEWSLAFCGGFRDLLPVFIRCKTKNGVGDGPARHLVKNTIELFPRYFDMVRARRTITMLHEMGHRCKSLLKPRDERHDLCSGGWNGEENMCYRTISEVDDFGELFSGGNPRILAEAATAGNGSAKKTLLNNIDNYVCFIWNRYIDRGEREMFLRLEGQQQGKPLPSGPGKPLPGNSGRSKPTGGSSGPKRTGSASSKPKRTRSTSKPKPIRSTSKPKPIKSTSKTKPVSGSSTKTKPIRGSSTKKAKPAKRPSKMTKPTTGSSSKTKPIRK
ncbi:MAG: hypothetical protein ACRBK7_12710 [Acidimicrobiales bacterium]